MTESLLWAHNLRMIERGIIPGALVYCSIDFELSELFPRRTYSRACLSVVTPHCPMSNNKIPLVKEELDIVAARIES
jgi:hypothetical protein